MGKHAYAVGFSFLNIFLGFSMSKPLICELLLSLKRTDYNESDETPLVLEAEFPQHAKPQ